VQYRGDLADGVIDAGLPEDLSRHGGAADVAEQFSSVKPNRQARPMA
jgi:hypothetical protein